MKKLDWKSRKHINFKKIMDASKKQKLKYLSIFLASGAWISSMTLGIVSFTLHKNNYPKVNQEETIEKNKIKNKYSFSEKSFSFLMDDKNEDRKLSSRNKDTVFYHLEKNYDVHDFIYILRNVEDKNIYKLNLMWFKNAHSDGLKQIFSWDESRFLNDFVLKNKDNEEIKLFFEWIQDVKTKKWSLILKKVNSGLSANKSFMFNLNVQKLTEIEVEKENKLRQKLEKLDHVYFWTIINKNKLASEVANDPTTKERIKKLVCIKRLKDYEIKLISDDEFGFLYMNIENHGFVKPIKLRGFQTTYEKTQKQNNEEIKKYLNSSNAKNEIRNKLLKTSLPSAISSAADTVNKIKSSSVKLANLKPEDIIMVPNDATGVLEIIFIVDGEEIKIQIDKFQKSGIAPNTADLTNTINALTEADFNKIKNLNKLPSKIAGNVAYKNLIKSIPGLNTLALDKITLKADDANGTLKITIKNNNAEKVITVTGLKTKGWKSEREKLLKDFKSLNIPKQIQVFNGADDKITQEYKDALKEIKDAQTEIRKSFDNAFIKNKINLIKNKIDEIKRLNKEQIKSNFDYQLTTLGNDEKMPSHILKDLESRILNFKNIGVPIKKEDISVISSNDKTGELKIKIKNFKGSQEFKVPNVLTKKAWKLKLFGFIKPEYASLFEDSLGRLWLAQENTRMKVLKPGDYFWKDVAGKGFKDGQNFDFFEDSKGTIWITGTDQPIYALFYGKEKWETTFYKNTSSAEVQVDYEATLFEDNEGYIWTTKYEGDGEDTNIIRWSPYEKIWEIFRLDLKVLNCGLFFQDWKNKLYFADKDGLYEITWNQRTYQKIESSLNNKIFDGFGAKFLKTSKNDLYGIGNDSSGTGRGSPLQVLKYGQEKWEDAVGSGITDGQFGFIFEDSLGNIWAAGVRSRLYILKRGSVKWEEAGNGSNVKDGKFSTMFEDSNKTLWMLGRSESGQSGQKTQLQYKKINEGWENYPAGQINFYLSLDFFGVNKNRPWFYEDNDGDIWLWIQGKGVTLLEKM